MPFARQKVLQAIGLEPDGTIDEAVLVAAGVVPEGVTVPDADARRILERAAAGVAVRLRQQPAPASRAAMEFPHHVDRIAEMFEGVVCSEHADLCVAKRPPVVEIGANPSAMQIDSFVTGDGVDPTPEVDLPQVDLIGFVARWVARDVVVFQ